MGIHDLVSFILFFSLRPRFGFAMWVWAAAGWGGVGQVLFPGIPSPPLPTRTAFQDFLLENPQVKRLTLKKRGRGGGKLVRPPPSPLVDVVSRLSYNW